MSGFNDKTVLITGGTSGIGRSTALGFAAAGANVVIAGRNEAPGLEVIKAAEDSPGKCSFHRADIAIESDVEELVDSVITSYGQLDIAVNTAGINPHGPLDTRSSEDFDTIFAVNTKGVFLCLKHMIRAMKASGGAILQVGSIASERSLAQRGLYCASKSAANMLVRTAAIEAAPFGIRINEVAPGTVDTPMLRETWSRREESVDTLAASVMAAVPLKRLGEASELAAAIMFLCSDQAGYITGARLTIDGGLILVV